MQTIYETVVLGFGNHASLEIPAKNLAELGGSKRAPLKITIKGYTYRSTATGVDGACRVVFPLRDRQATGVTAGDRVTVMLELESGYRPVDVPSELTQALNAAGLSQLFHDLAYSKRKEFARQVAEAKAPDTKSRRIAKIISLLSGAS